MRASGSRGIQPGSVMGPVKPAGEGVMGLASFYIKRFTVL